MPTTIVIDPVTRIEGHLSIEVTVDSVGGEDQVVDARGSGTMFRGFEILLLGRDPRDTAQLTQRICGVCPVSHALASCMNLDQAFGVTPPENGRLLRNLVLAANYLQSHVLHFYHLSAPDFIDTTGILDMSPWTPRYNPPDLIGGATAATLVGHYVEALHIRRKAHQMGAIYSGKLPCTGSYVVGGLTPNVTAENVADFRALLAEIRAFVDNVYVPDAMAIAAAFPSYYSLGVGYGNMLSFGVFDQDAAGTSKFFGSGHYTNGTAGPLDEAQITESVKHGWFTDATGTLHPSQGETNPEPDKPTGYTWLKAPRYTGAAHEVGPLARMWIDGHYTNGVSMMDRVVARALETQMLAAAMDGWLDQLVPGDPTYAPSAVPVTATGAGLTEAPRGALGHWMDVTDSTVSRYQVITPTAWNTAPRDDLDQLGPTEQALLGTPVLNINEPVEILRIVHSFDPCLACAVHMVRPGKRKHGKTFLIPPGIA